jgi:hypothetical protein
MSIQSAINQILGSVESLARFQKIGKPIMKALGDTFGEQPSSDKKSGELGELLDVESGIQEARDNIAQREHQASGQADRDLEYMVAYEEQQREKGYETEAIQSLENRTAEIGNIKQEHKKRREYLRKPHVRNKHGVKYIDGVKQEETK